MQSFQCPICKNEENKQVYPVLDFENSEEPYELVQCTECGVTQTFPFPDSETLEKYYAKDYYGRGTKKFSGPVEALTVLNSKLRARKIRKLISQAGSNETSPKVLDVGCGRATLLKQLNQLGCECYGVERSKYPEENGAHNIDLYHGELKERNFDDSFFDAVIIWHVLEHLDQPSVTMDEIARITRSNGILAIAVPNFSSFQARIFKSNWFHLDIPRHLFHFDIKNLSGALKQRGYCIDSVSTFSVEQNLFGFIQSLLNFLKFPGKPNTFYQLLKKSHGVHSKIKLLLGLTAALFILPLATLELILSSLFKTGATVIIFAHKADDRSI